LPKFQLVLLIHAHQPIGNFDKVIEQTYVHAYLPFIECLERHPGVRAGLHYSGCLLEWLETHHPEYLTRLAAMAGRGQVELVGGGFYEPILIAISPRHQREQIRRLSDFLFARFGKRPAGAWLAERVWEPQLPAVLADAGVQYTLVDDSHFLSAGFEPDQLHGSYIAEELGRAVRVLPGLQSLRYLIPFRDVEEVMASLRASAEAHPGCMSAMGDDLEKFGGWPHTWEHCYRDGWLERFFAALETNAEWLEVVLPADALAATAPLGRADLPTASYTEMMEWVLPTGVRQRFHAVREEFSGRPDISRFLRGGFWRGFFTKYAEANLLHKKMLRVSAKLERLRRRRGDRESRERTIQAISTHLLRAQCNDAYWHGVFGGLYSPHLRTALWRELVSAETRADAALQRKTDYHAAERLDFDADGREEVEMVSPEFAALIKPSDGGTLAALDFRPRSVTLINSMQRRVEAYHSRVHEAAAQSGQRVASIHELTRAKEEGLERLLRYDRWPRHAFRLLLFSRQKSHADYETLRLEESATFAAGNYAITACTAKSATLAMEAAPGAAIPDGGRLLQATKSLTFGPASNRFSVVCKTELSEPKSVAPGANHPQQFCAGVELVLNLLAPNEPDRYFEYPGNRHPLAWNGIVPGTQIIAVDEWQDVAVELNAPNASHLWVAPIETVSESEDGFERVYQGSQILAVWPVDRAAGSAWNGEVSLTVTDARSRRKLS